jgi:beta-carotene isomerase D27-like protein
MTVSPSSRNAMWRLYDRLQVWRARRAYASISGWRSSAPGYDGLVEELRHGLATLPDATRAEADRRLLTAVLGGRIAAAMVTLSARRWPGAVARLFARLTPNSFYFLVGPNTRTGPVTIDVPSCRFVSAGGRDLCLHVCKAPSEAYYAALGLPLRLNPDLASHRCTFHYG